MKMKLYKLYVPVRALNSPYSVSDPKCIGDRTAALKRLSEKLSDTLLE